MSQPRQPFLHDLAILVAAPSQVLSTTHGGIGAGAGPVGVQGVWHADRRVLSRLHLTVDGEMPEHIATLPAGPGRESGDALVFSFLVRHAGGGQAANPSTPVRLDVERRLQPGRVAEWMTITSWLAEPVTIRLELAMAGDLAPIAAVMAGATPPPPPAVEDLLVWRSAEIEARLEAPGAGVAAGNAGPDLTWVVTLPAKGRATVGWTLEVTDHGSVVVPARTHALDAAGIARELSGPTGDHRLRPWLERSLTDLDGLLMATPDSPEDAFFAAGSPW
jgi:hypothetical protein